MPEIFTIIDITRFIVGVGVLSYASYTDIKTRRASNINWLIMGAVGAVLVAVQYLSFTPEEQDLNKFYLLFIPIMIGLVYGLFQLRIIFGGADAKALMAIAILVPFEPNINQFPIWSGTPMPYSWSVFSNSIILFLFIPLSILLFNLIKRKVEFPYAFLGYKMSIKKAREKFVWPLEKLVDGKRKFVYMPKDFDADKEFDEFEKNGFSEIWVTPKIPFMIPLLAGFISAFILGDILFHIMRPF